MVKIAFTLQDAPDFWTELNADCLSLNGDALTVRDEANIADLIYSRFPKLRECNRRIKNLIITDDNKGKTYATNDFDVPGSLKKIEK